MAAQECVPTNEKKDAFAADYRVLNRAWNALSPDSCLAPHKVDYRWLSRVYESIKPTDNRGALIWAALGKKTIDLIHQHVDVGEADENVDIISLTPDLIDDFLSNQEKMRKKTKEIEINLVAKIQKHSKDPKFIKLGEKLQALRDKHEFAGEIMIILVTGASHTGKTALAQKLLEKYKYPYLSIDHLKMGLIRSGNTELTPMSDDTDLTAYLWPIVREMIKTAIENNQNLIVEGCYVPFDWQKDFDSEYLESIKYYCLVMSEEYIRNHFADIKKYARVIENRLDDEWCTMESVLADNLEMLALAREHNVNYILIDDKYEINIEL